MTKSSLLLLILFSGSVLYAEGNPPQLLLRLDDCGMNHAVTMAIKQVAQTGIPFSTSVMFTCPWYQEAVAVLKQFPNVSPGVHLVLNSEWKYYRWGPVLGRSAVPSLVDVDGFFLPSTDEFLQSHYKRDEVEKELEAQIQRAFSSGLKVDYVDYHMWTAVATPQLRAIVEKLAKKHHLGISRYFGENYQSLFDVPIEAKKSEFFQRVGNLRKDAVNLIVFHVGQDTPEMEALIDMNDAAQHSDAKPLVAMHRSAELNVLLSSEFQDLVKSG
ncbi:MAG TPA: ChbG/HpnK family deacetylase, partial [Acidobacteriota bacterium]|nr:ChbG/HpnK family deacetylase [Acidobacteriota bacterium]